MATKYNMMGYDKDGNEMPDPSTYIPPRKTLGGIEYEAPSPVYPDAWVPVRLTPAALRDMSFGDLCDALKACFYSEPGGTDTAKCAALIREIRESFKHSAY